MHIRQTHTHTTWDKSLLPIVEVSPGAEVTVEIPNASGGQLDRASTVTDVKSLDFARVNPVTGPIAIVNCAPDDAVVISILDIEMDNWGWTANIPGFGLLADQFPEAHLRLSTIRDDRVHILSGIELPVEPMIGTIGLAPAEPGPHSMVPPHNHGGNMDIRHVATGSTLLLPAAVPGGLLSVGDTHAAMGDGEVCGTGVESSSIVRLRIDLEKGRSLPTPQLISSGKSYRSSPCLVTTGIGPDLHHAAADATAYLIDEVVRRTGLAAIDAYLLASIAADLQISEIVDMPHVVVSMHLPLTVIEQA